jgi:hypothetical protein
LVRLGPVNTIRTTRNGSKLVSLEKHEVGNA